MMRRKNTLLTFLSTITLISLNAAAATFYISPSGSDTVGTGSEANPWKTSVRAFQMGGANTYIFKDGLYDYDEGGIVNPPSGIAGRPTVIKAQNPGRAVIDGGSSRIGIVIGDESTTRQYITVEGFKVVNKGDIPAISIGSPDGTDLKEQTHNITVRQTGAKALIQSSNDAVWGIGRLRDSLFEDIWAWGEGRYTFNAYGCTNITVRRAVFRWDGWGDGADKPNDPQFNMGVYNTHDSLFENIILIDHAKSQSTGDSGGLYLPGNNNGKTAPHTSSSGNRFFGLVILNNFGAGNGVEGGTGEFNRDNSFKDVVIWNHTEVGLTVPKKSANTTFDHVTIGKSGNGAYFGVIGSVFRNGLVIDNQGAGIKGIHTSGFNNVFGNGDNYDHGANAGGRSISANPKLKYITRLENGAPGKGAASDGGDMGATVVKRYVDGKLTDADLWPYPNQDRIKADMCAGLTKGFCGTASLTQYIWGYLGNANPYPSAASGVTEAAVVQVSNDSKPTEAGDAEPIDPSDMLRPRKKSIQPSKANDSLIFGSEAKKVIVINTGGRAVAHLHKIGSNRIAWDGRNDNGLVVEAGYYMCRIEGPNGKTVHQMVSVVK